MLFPVMEFFASLPSIPRPLPPRTLPLARVLFAGLTRCWRRMPSGERETGPRPVRNSCWRGLKRRQSYLPRLPLTGTQGSKYAGC